jgi:hypothetical protein
MGKNLYGSVTGPALLANGGMFLQTLAQAAAFALAGVAVWTVKE